MSQQWENLNKDIQRPKNWKDLLNTEADPSPADATARIPEISESAWGKRVIAALEESQAQAYPARGHYDDDDLARMSSNDLRSLVDRKVIHDRDRIATEANRWLARTNAKREQFLAECRLAERTGRPPPKPYWEHATNDAPE